MGKEVNMGKEGQKDRHPRTGGLIEFSTRKLSQGQGDSLRSMIYRRLVEEYGSIERLISRWEGHRKVAAFESANYETNRSRFTVSDSICTETQSQLAKLHSNLLSTIEFSA